ncbi:omega-amidase Nit [Thermacetogenium phaeum DSM 12270]|uniref:Omega-amidase Nit n=1 Tax=Thermacetogenium phaeum (strain ATCC BAA-254 / DSM 26808 / PB) TaxID=1089553 RepID=K4LCP6_THEPS|nr:carbon-nitrogen hydrolase family protein [Thermacetogenium phaeum]AFV10711.1 omega-amidase Nit [Thermacetogenium phaeum DSM 12270]MDN5375774.1 omega-amidase [Thermacetogenium sp.]
MGVVRVGLIQMLVEESKEKNLSRAEEMVREAAGRGAGLVVLPEMFNCPYSNEFFPPYAEQEGGYTWQRLSRMAGERRVFLVGGSVPERGEDGRIYNTSYIFDDRGRQIGKHRKVHLFDIDVEGQYFRESEILAPGSRATVFATPYGRMGVMICYDLRFPELARLLVQKGALVLVVPAAFNMTTGPAHWELLFRCRALDNQVFALGVAPARDEKASYVSYANSLIADPWGRVVVRLGEEEGILVEDLDLGEVEKIRAALPLLKHIRRDLYEVREKLQD